MSGKVIEQLKLKPKKEVSSILSKITHEKKINTSVSYRKMKNLTSQLSKLIKTR